MLDFNFLDFPTLFSIPMQDAFVGVMLSLYCFLHNCEIYLSFVSEPKPTDWNWVAYMLDPTLEERLEPTETPVQLSVVEGLPVLGTMKGGAPVPALSLTPVLCSISSLVSRNHVSLPVSSPVLTPTSVSHSFSLPGTGPVPVSALKGSPDPVLANASIFFFSLSL